MDKGGAERLTCYFSRYEIIIIRESEIFWYLKELISFLSNIYKQIFAFKIYVIKWSLIEETSLRGCKLMVIYSCHKIDRDSRYYKSVWLCLCRHHSWGGRRNIYSTDVPESMVVQYEELVTCMWTIWNQMNSSWALEWIPAQWQLGLWERWYLCTWHHS